MIGEQISFGVSNFLFLAIYRALNLCTAGPDHACVKHFDMLGGFFSV